MAPAFYINDVCRLGDSASSFGRVCDRTDPSGGTHPSRRHLQELHAALGRGLGRDGRCSKLAGRGWRKSLDSSWTQYVLFKLTAMTTNVGLFHVVLVMRQLLKPCFGGCPSDAR